MPNKQINTNNVFGIWLVVLSAIGFSLLGVFAKLAFRVNVSVETLLTARTIISVILLWVYVILFVPKEKIFGHSKKEIIFCVLAGIFGFWIAPFSGISSVVYINIGLAAILFSSVPVFVILLSSLINKRLPSQKELIVLVATQIGIYFVIGGNKAGVEGENILLGTLFCLVGAACAAVYVVISQKATVKMNSFIFVIFSLSVATLFIIGQFIFSGEHVNLNLSPYAYMIITLSGLCYTISYLLLAKGIKIIGSSRAALINSCSPVFSVIFSYVIFSQGLTLIQIMGGTVIILSLLFMEKKTISLLRKNKLPNA